MKQRNGSVVRLGLGQCKRCAWPQLPSVWMLSLCLLTALAVLPIAPAMAVVPEMPRLRVLDVEDGLPSSHVNGVIEDGAGYLWLATIDGLARYDGVEMRVWRHAPDDAAGLPGNYITAIHADAQDRIWVAVEGRGLSVLDRDRRHFRHYSKATHPAMGSDDVWAIASHGDNTWFGTFDGGLHRISDDADLGPDRIERHVHRADDARSLPSDTILSLRFDTAGALWVGTLEGLARWTGRDFERVALPGDMPAPRIFSITPEDRTLWIGASSGVYRREADSRWHTPDWSAMFATPNHLFDLVTDERGHRWLASTRQLWRVAPGQVPHPVPINTHGPVRSIFQILRQADGALWFPAAGAGLGYIRPDWRRIAQFSSGNSALSGELYRSVTPASAGGMWLIGGRGEIERIDSAGQVHPLSARLQSRMQGRRPISSVEDRAGRLWTGEASARPALVRIAPDGEFREWSVDSGFDSTLRGPIEMLRIAPDGTLWVFHSGAGLQQRDPDSGRVLESIVSGPEQGLGVGDLEAMTFADDGTLWVAGDMGLAYWDAVANRFRNARGIDGDRVYAFAFEDARTIWLQRLSGLEQYRRNGDDWQLLQRVGDRDGIPAVEGSGLHVDARKRIWLATLRGLYRWDPQSRHVRRFGLSDGLSSQEFIDRGTGWHEDGVLVAALADGGVVLLDTQADDSPAQHPALHWDRVEVRRGGQWVPLADEDGGLTLAPQDRELRVQLRLLAFDAPASNRYFTWLDGYDAEWVAHDAGGERVFAGLPPGAYTLRARAVDGIGNAAAEQTLQFRVSPPWWRTPWALAGALGLLLLTGWWAIDIWRDRLRRRQAQQRAEHERSVAEQASLAKTRFLATLGHEVRTPMTGVLGMSELLLATDLNPQQRGYTRSIRQAGDHLMRLVNDALDLARIESGKLELADEPFDLRELIDEAAALMAPLARQRGLTFALDVADDVPGGVRGDGKRVCQILLNLLGNAIKFTERGSVSLRATRGDGDVIRFEIADTGPGLNDEQKSRLFRRFEQAEGARTAARYGGSGLGLAICQELAAAMDGQIAVDSTPGVGTRFSVRLPLAAATLRPEAAGAANAGPASGRRPLALLLVEDDPTVAEVIAGLLRTHGHAVMHASNGLTALTEIATGRFDAALLDLDLPGMDGFMLARQLRAQGFARPLIAITARADADVEPLALAAGFDRFLRKPVTSAVLQRVLEEAVPESQETAASAPARTPALSS